MDENEFAEHLNEAENVNLIGEETFKVAVKQGLWREWVKRIAGVRTRKSIKSNCYTREWETHMVETTNTEEKPTNSDCRIGITENCLQL